MSIQVGALAPAATAAAYVRGEAEPRAIRLSEQRGKWLVLFFYPRDFTFVCPTEIQEFARLHADFTAEDAVVLGASTDSFYAHTAWYESDPRLAPVTFPVLADTSQELAAAYGVLLEDGAALRGTFIIDPEGKLRHAQINDLDIGRNINETLRLLRALRTGERCPAAWQPGQATLTVHAPEPRPDGRASRIVRVTDETFAQFSASERAVLVLARSDCEHCQRYAAEIEESLERGQLAGMAVGKLTLDQPGATQFKRDNHWLIGLESLPFTMLYRHGAVIDTFGASRGAYLVERATNSFAATTQREPVAAD